MDSDRDTQRERRLKMRDDASVSVAGPRLSPVSLRVCKIPQLYSRALRPSTAVVQIDSEHSLYSCTLLVCRVSRCLHILAVQLYSCRKSVQRKLNDSLDSFSDSSARRNPFLPPTKGQKRYNLHIRKNGRSARFSARGALPVPTWQYHALACTAGALSTCH